MGAEFAKEFELPVASEEEASAAEDWVREMVQQSDGKKLWLQHWDTFADAIQPGVAPETDHASVLWRMSKKRRMALWRELSPKLRVTTLGISGNFSDKCFFDDEEFCALFPHKRSLQSVHTLSLSFCWGLSDYSIDKFIAAGGGSSLKSLRFHFMPFLSDESLESLASAGCAPQLEDITFLALPRMTDRGLIAMVSAGCGAKLKDISVDCSEMTQKGNFAAVLGLPVEFHDRSQFSPQEVYMEWCNRHGIQPIQTVPSSGISFSGNSTVSGLASTPPELQLSPFLKTCVVGRPAVGKTCLTTALAGGSFDSRSTQTDGIVLRRVPLDRVPLDGQLLDISLRIMDAGGQTYFDFLKPMLMQDRAVVLLCVKGRDDGSLVAEVQEYLDTLSTLMHGGVVVPVVTHADEISSMGPLHRLWSLEVVPLFEQYSGRLRIDPTLVAVSSVTGTGIDELKERLRISATMLPESHERHRPCYIDFASALLHELESGVRVLTREEAHSIAESCGFHGTAEASIALRIMEKWMITCKLTSKESPPLVVLDVEWLSLLLTPLVHPDPRLLVEEGILSQERLFANWVLEGLLPNAEACRCFLLSLRDLHISQEIIDSRYSEPVVFSPHALSDRVRPHQVDTVGDCSAFPHFGWVATPGVCAGDWKQKRKPSLVDPIVICQLLTFLRSVLHMEVLFLSRTVAVVRPDKDSGSWFLVCSTPSSIALSLVQESFDPQTCGPIGEMSITLAPLERKGPAENCLGRLSSAARIFLQQEHPQLLDQLSELSMCPQCQEKGGGKLMRPGSFSTAELTLAEKSKGFIKCKRCHGRQDVSSVRKYKLDQDQRERALSNTSRILEAVHQVKADVADQYLECTRLLQEFMKNQTLSEADRSRMMNKVLVAMGAL